MRRRRLVPAAVTAHLSLTALHGGVHAAIPVVPSGWTAAFAAISLGLLPVAGVGLVVRGRHRTGGAVLLAAGILGFGFEGALHFLIGNPDHVARVESHRASFGLTAILTTAGDLLLVVAAWVCVRNRAGAASV